MSKFRSLILIIGLLLIAVAAALLTVLILYATGTIVTDPIELVYTVESDNKVYDGKPLTVEEYSLVSGEILEGHKVKVQVIGSQTEVGESEVTLDVKLYDKNDFDVTREYAVKVNAGKLTVDKRSVSVVIPDSQVYYCGREVEFKDNYEFMDETSLAPGHKLAGLNTTLMNAGQSLPKDVQPLVYDAFGTNVTENYDIKMEVGDVEILPRPITLKPKAVTKVYDGVKTVATEYEIIEGSLVAGQTASVRIVSEAGAEASAVNVSTTRIMIDKRNFAIYDGVVPVTANYDVDYSATDFLKIEKRPVTIRTATDTFVYDGEEHSNDGYTLSGEFAPNQTFNFVSSKKVTDVTKQAVDNEIEYEILLDGVDVSSNYSVTMDYGKLTVTPLKLTVQTNSYEKVYDGSALRTEIEKDDKSFTTIPELPEKFTLSATISSEVLNQINVKDGSFKLNNVVIKIGEDVCSENFEITVVDGTYAITPKPVTVSLNELTNSDKFVYGREVEITKNEALNAQELTAYSLTQADFEIIQLKDYSAGVHEYGAEFVRNDEYAANLTVTVIPGKVNIARKKVTLANKTPDEPLTMIYNGAHSYYDAKLDNVPLLITDYTEYKVTAAEFDVEFLTENDYQTVKVKSVEVASGDKDITSNLEIDCSKVEVKVTVIKRTLELKFSTYFSSYWTIDEEALPNYVDVSASTPLDGDDMLLIEKMENDGYEKFWISEYKIINRTTGKDVTHLYTEITPAQFGNIVHLNES